MKRQSRAGRPIQSLGTARKSGGESGCNLKMADYSYSEIKADSAEECCAKINKIIRKGERVLQIQIVCPRVKGGFWFGVFWENLRH
jgi:hypothetical protein